MASYQLYIDSSWTASSGDAVLTVLNPATEEVIGSVPEGTVSDVERAVSAVAARLLRPAPPRARTLPSASSTKMLSWREVQVIADPRGGVVAVEPVGLVMVGRFLETDPRDVGLRRPGPGQLSRVHASTDRESLVNRHDRSLRCECSEINTIVLF